VLCFIVFPLVFIFAFAVRPGLLHPHFLGPSEIIQRARGHTLLQWRHALVMLDTALLVVVAVHFTNRLALESTASWDSSARYWR